MAIMNNKYVDITTKEVGASAVARREMMPRFVVNNKRIGVGHVFEFANANDVKSAFGIESDEYRLAVKAFSYVSNATTSVNRISFARWTPEGIAGYLLAKKVPSLGDILDSNKKITFLVKGESVTIDFSSVIDSDITTLDGLVAALNTELNKEATATLVKGGEFEKDTFGGVDYLRFNYPTGMDKDVYACTPFTEANDMATIIGFTDATGVICSNAITAETPVSAISRIDAISDNFGSFAFLPYKDSSFQYVFLTDEEIKSVATWNEALNYKYAYATPINKEEKSNWIDYVVNKQAPAGIVAVAYDPENGWDFDEFMPMVLFASTNYGRQNGTNSQMYKQFSDVNPSVLETTESDELDLLHINYYGLSQHAGKDIAFYQRGYNMNGEDTATYCNEVWLKDAIKTELLNLQISTPKIPANNVGEAQCIAVIRGVIDEALNNGTIIAGAKLTNIQKINAINLLGDDAPNAIELDGFYLKVEINTRTDENNTELHYLDYYLGYKKGDAIRKVVGSHGLL